MNRGDLFAAKQRRFKKGFLIASAIEVTVRVQVNNYCELSKWSTTLFYSNNNFCTDRLLRKRFFKFNRCVCKNHQQSILVSNLHDLPVSLACVADVWKGWEREFYSLPFPFERLPRRLCVADALNLLYRADYTNGLDECVGRLQRRLPMMKFI